MPDTTSCSFYSPLHFWKHCGLQKILIDWFSSPSAQRSARKLMFLVLFYKCDAQALRLCRLALVSDRASTGALVSPPSLMLFPELCCHQTGTHNVMHPILLSFQMGL
jgi:hypothetical protein